MSVWSATRWNPVIRVFYQRVREKGKPAKVAPAACMRKLLILQLVPKEFQDVGL